MSKSGSHNKLLNTYSQFGAQIKLDIENAKIFEEIVFAISKRILIPASATPGATVLDIALDPTACTCDFFVFLPVFFEAFGAGPIFVDLYVNPVYTGGTTIVPTNRDLSSLKTSDAVWKLAPSVSDPGIKTPSEFVIFSNGTAAVAKAGGSSKGDLATNIDKTKKYMFRFENQENVEASAIITANWFEVPVGP